MLKKIIILLIALVTFVVISATSFINNYIIIGIIAAVLSIVCIFFIIYSYRHNYKKLIFMLNAMEANDFNFHFDDNRKDKTIDSMFNYTLNKIKYVLEIEKNAAAEKERYYETMLEKADTGIMAVDNNNFVIYRNLKALNILGLPLLTHLKQLARINEALANIFINIADGDNKNASFYNEQGKTIVSINCSRVCLKDEDLRIISINRINKEIESAELETWSRLIRVLTHEIMNSISPIASLSETLSKYCGENVDELKEGLEVINKTSEGLISFVESYRSLTRISKPQKKAVALEEMVNSILTLVKDDINSAGMKCTLHSSQNNIMLYIDENQISQVMINLIRNAIQAQSSILNINATIDHDETIRIEFANNGKPIATENIDRIFIPFYTTKTNGSGIGLSISRQIMQMHEGSIQLLRSNEKETTFILLFN
ncbi:MAG: PAS domain-containing sensor histidine kinase [Bacteroidales bacterium]|nr:PAS domain-containing sensor histidine kinase [Bacteroidales bacterium]